MLTVLSVAMSQSPVYFASNMLSSNLPSAARARLENLSKGSSSPKSYRSSSATTTESFTCMKETKTLVAKSPLLDQGECEVPYSQATTIAHESPLALNRDLPIAPIARVLDVAFAEPPPDAVVVDLSDFVDTPTKVIVKVEKTDTAGPVEDSPESFYTHCKRLGYCTSPPDAPSGQSPLKKKPDACPSDEKKSAFRAPAFEETDKENVDRSFAKAAPFFHHNGEKDFKQSSKAVPFRKDLMTANQAAKGFKQRKAAPKTLVLVQSVIAPDSRQE